MAAEAVARLAATIMLLRDGPDGLEVFMVVRHHAIDFASGALVFPGGRVEDTDHTLADRADLCPNPDSIARDIMALRLAAIRETFEECGVLLARPAGSPHLLGADHLRTVEQAHRTALGSGEIAFETVLGAHGLVAAPDLLVPFAHWITPSHQPKRYDTHFFLAEAPAEHLALHDGSEAVDSVWIPPAQALADTDAGRFKLVFATQRNLEKLSRSRTVADAMQAAKSSPVVTVLPQSRKLDEKRRHLIIPIEAGYGASEFIVDLPPAS